MAVHIRLLRQGARKKPEYLVVVVDRDKKRDGEYLEKLGYYYPKAKMAKDKIKLNKDLTDKWLKVGAQPTKTVGQLLKIASK